MDGLMMLNSTILDLPLSRVMRSEIALPLQHIMQIYTVGSLLSAWRSPRNQKSIEQIFDTPEQARHAINVCATWIGVSTQATTAVDPGWWLDDRPSPAV